MRAECGIRRWRGGEERRGAERRGREDRRRKAIKAGVGSKSLVSAAPEVSQPRATHELADVPKEGIYRAHEAVSSPARESRKKNAPSTSTKR